MQGWEAWMGCRLMKTVVFLLFPTCLFDEIGCVQGGMAVSPNSVSITLFLSLVTSPSPFLLAKQT